MDDRTVEQTARAIRQKARELSNRLRDLAENGPEESEVFEPTGIVRETGSDLDRLCGEYALLRRLAGSENKATGPAENSRSAPREPWSMIVDFWGQISDDLYSWASHRSYSKVANATEMINSAVEVRDLGMIREAAAEIAEDLENRTAKKHVRRYAAKARHLVRLADRAIEQRTAA